jgi:UDP-N-acetylglucosamine 2-epimerase (non-hydrolysing)
MKKILIVVGTRPNFIKVTQFRSASQEYPGMDIRIVHTGQHYDSKMADVFFEQFGLVPDYFLNIPAGSPVSQMARIMLGLEETVHKFTPDLMLVVGDVNSTFAAALTANKMGIPLAHVESGLRSHDRTMPEEFNRLLTDLVSDYFFVTEQSGYDALIGEGVERERIFFVGNTMIDTLVAYRDEIEASDVLGKYSLKQDGYALMTMHRPATVDSKEGLEKLVQLIQLVTKTRKLVFPVHPRTLKHIEQFGLGRDFTENTNLVVTGPLDYFAFQKLVNHCKFILTDSGGIQEESTYLQKPCLTFRPNTERPVTITLGTNLLVPFELVHIQELITSIDQGTFKKGEIPPCWDGKATQRLLKVIAGNFQKG